MLTPADNRYRLPAFYSLHAWIWKHNPKGTFEQWNPQVHCGGSQASGVDVNDQAAAAPSLVGMGATFTCPVPATEPAIDMEPSALGPR